MFWSTKRIVAAFGPTVLLGTWVMLSSGCATSTRYLDLHTATNSIPAGDPAYKEKLQIQYLGCSGFLMRRGSDVLLTAPFYSNPWLWQTTIFPICSKTNRVNELLPDVSDVKTILVGHSHYDHLMDVPFVANHRAKEAKIYGSDTMSNLLSCVVEPRRLQGLDSDVGEFHKGGSPGKWTTNETGRIRFMPLSSEHAPHLVGGVKLYCGEIVKPATRLPRTAWGWREGQTLAYVIDFLTGTNIDYRVFYHDSAVNCPRFGGLPDFLPGDKHPVDVSILCMASSEKVKNYPQGIVKMQNPTNVIVSHWEDFFRSPKRKPKVVRNTNNRRFVEVLRDECGFPTNRTFVPVRNAVMQFDKSP